MKNKRMMAILLAMTITAFGFVLNVQAAEEVHYDEPGIPVTEEMVTEWKNSSINLNTSWIWDYTDMYDGTVVEEGTQGGRHYIKMAIPISEDNPDTLIATLFDDYKVTKDGKWVYTTDWLPPLTKVYINPETRVYGTGDFGICYEKFAKGGYGVGECAYKGYEIGFDPRSFFQEYWDPNNLQHTVDVEYSKKAYGKTFDSEKAEYLENLYRPHDGNGIRIVGYYGDDADIVVPSTIEGKPVTIVENIYYHVWSFRSLSSDPSYIEYTPTKSITIPEGVIGIWNIDSSPERMGDLKEVTFPTTLKYMFNSFCGKNTKGMTINNMPSADKMVGCFAEPWATDDDYLTQWEINYHRGEDCDAICLNESNSHPYLKENGYDYEYPEVE